MCVCVSPPPRYLKALAFADSIIFLLNISFFQILAHSAACRDGGEPRLQLKHVCVAFNVSQWRGDIGETHWRVFVRVHSQSHMCVTYIYVCVYMYPHTHMYIYVCDTYVSRLMCVILLAVVNLVHDQAFLSLIFLPGRIILEKILCRAPRQFNLYDARLSSFLPHPVSHLNISEALNTLIMPLTHFRTGQFRPHAHWMLLCCICFRYI